MVIRENLNYDSDFIHLFLTMDLVRQHTFKQIQSRLLSAVQEEQNINQTLNPVSNLINIYNILEPFEDSQSEITKHKSHLSKRESLPSVSFRS